MPHDSFKKRRFRQEFTYRVDLDERGEFCAAVINRNGRDVVKLHANGEDLDLVTDGWMKHSRDIAGLLEWLQHVGAAKPDATIRMHTIDD